MKPQLILAILPALTAGTAAANTLCEAEYRDLLLQKYEGYPYKGRTITKFGQQEFEGIGVIASMFHSYGNDPKTGVSTLFQGRDLFQSTDGEKTWKKITTMPADTEEKTIAMHGRQAESATDISCKNGEKYKDETYRTVSGKYVSGTASDVVVSQKYYMKGERGPDTVWWVRISESVVNGQKSIVVHEKITSGDSVVVPTVKQ